MTIFSGVLPKNFLNFLANKYEINEPVVNEIIESNNAKYSNIKVDNINIGIIIPKKQIHKMEKKR